MAWFRHHFSCEACAGHWLAEAERAIEADCPLCGARDVAPYKSDDRSFVVEAAGARFAVLELSARGGACHQARRRSFANRAQAEAFRAALAAFTRNDGPSAPRRPKRQAAPLAAQRRSA
jgi:hypothetical protein